MTFEDMLNRLRDEVRARVAGGDITERGLARRVGLSQPHMHHVLKSSRKMSPEIADKVLQELRLTVFDLLPQRCAPD